MVSVLRGGAFGYKISFPVQNEIPRFSEEGWGGLNKTGFNPKEQTDYKNVLVID